MILLALAASADATPQRPIMDIGARVAPGAIVTCVPLPGVYGDSWRDDDGVHIRLSTPTCSGLARLVEHRIRNWSVSANSLETLIHEHHHWPAGDPDGVMNESIVDCQALHAMPFWLHRLGYTGTAAKRLLAAAWLVHWGLPSNYLSTPCADPFGVPKPIYYTLGDLARGGHAEPVA